MKQISHAMFIHGVSVRSMRYTEEGDRWIPIKRQDVWVLQNIETGETVPLCDWLAVLTRQMREAGTMGEHTTTTINKVIITVPQRGENVDMCPNSCEYMDFLAAARFDNGEFKDGIDADTGKPVNKTLLAAACRGKRISPAGTKAELLGRLARTRVDGAEKPGSRKRPSETKTKTGNNKKRVLNDAVRESNLGATPLVTAEA